MYDRISHSPDDLDPDNFFRSVHVHGSYFQLYEPGEQEPEDPEVGDDTQDYTIYFDNLITNSDLIVEQNEYISEQLNTLNENIVVLNDNIKIGIGFGFGFCYRFRKGIGLCRGVVFLRFRCCVISNSRKTVASGKRQYKAQRENYTNQR